jgi:peptidoglycan-associated lipoprotein
MRHSRSVLTLSLLLLAGGCHHEKVAVVSPSKPMLAGPPPTTVRPSAHEQGSGGTTACKADLDCMDKQLCIGGSCVDITAGLPECSMVRVHFDFAMAEIHDNEVPALNRIASCLKADLALHVRIEGNADERGTEEYNLALGDRRATAVARYLESLGVTQEQLRTVSYGQDKPFCVEHDESCWAKNRRASLKPKEAKR